MKLEGTFLRSKFGRRIFIMFGLAVIIPAAVVFALTYQHAAGLASANEAASLRVFNKSFALAVFDRLQLAQSALQRMPSGVGALPADASGRMFTQVVDAQLPVTSESGAAFTSSRDGLLILSEGTARPQVALLVRSGQGAEQKTLMGILDSGFLWGDPEAAISDGRICVQSGRTRLSCVGSVPADSSGPLMKDQWDLVLAPEFGAASWRFVAVKTQRGSFAQYADLFLPVAAGMLFLALLLSSLAIRRILVPLEALLRRIAAVGGGQTIGLETADDEFVTLDRTFQAMESRIGHQILMLKTLQEIDQLILERVPLSWVIALVTERVSAIVGARPVAISLISPGADAPERHFLRRPDGSLAADAQAGSIRGAEISANPAPSLPTRTREWHVVDGVGPGFAEFDLAAVWSRTVGQEAGPLVRMSIGQYFSEAGQNLPQTYDEHGELEELADRVAVALAAEARETRLVHQARHDLLTNLPNRLAVFELLPDVIGKARESSRGFATLFVDLDRFKSINDGLGHVLGDTVLVEVARRIQMAAGAEAVVARLGGDEFLVVVPNADGTAALSVDHAIRASLKDPVWVEGRSLFLDFSAGIALYPQDGTDPEKLMHNADVAMYRAKRLGGGRAMLFDAGMNQAATRRVQMESDLRLAVGAGQLHLEYQPRIDSRNGSIIGAEALVRWAHPVWGRVGPDEFIGVAEECGMIGAIGAFVIQSACRQMADWRSAGLHLPLVAVNVSPRQLRTGDLFDTIAEAIIANGLNWGQLEIEITESVLVKDSEFASEQLQRMRDAGCTVAIDDFGTGYSSLAYLTSLPTDTIKIDRGFFADLQKPGAQAIVRSIIALGRTLGKTIVAEGVETRADLALLNSWDCHIVQGFVYFPPLAPAAMAELLRVR